MSKPSTAPDWIHVQSLALRDPLDDVHENDVSELLFDDPLGDGRAHVSRTDHGDFASHDFAPSLHVKVRKDVPEKGA